MEDLFLAFFIVIVLAVLLAAAYYRSESRVVGPPIKEPFLLTPLESDSLRYDYTVIDVETTGLQPTRNEIIEIGAIKYRNHVETSRYHTFVRPTCPLPKEITALTGITDSMVQNAPTLEEIADELLDFLGSDCLVGHNINFDMGFIQTRLSMYLGKHVIDTLKLSRECLPDLENHKLITLKSALGIQSASHNAMDDCESTAKVYQYCYQMRQDEKKEAISRLSDEELAYFNQIKQVLEEAGYNTDPLGADSNGTFLFCNYNRSTFLPIKLKGRLRYCLFIGIRSHIMVKEYLPDCPLRIEASPISEGADNTRVFVSEPADIKHMAKAIVYQYSRFVPHN